MVMIPKVPEGGVDVPVDLDVQKENLPNVGCSAAVMSNDKAHITNRSVDGETALCVRFFDEGGGVAGSGYENCVVADGRVVSIDIDGKALSGASDEKGKERIVSLVAQAYDCYVQSRSGNELAQYLMTNADDISPLELSRLMWKYQPYFNDWRFLPVDVDENKEFLPSVSYVTVGTGMVNDGIIVEPFEVTEKGLRFCFDFESEVKAPYGGGAWMCINEEGGIETEDGLGQGGYEERYVRGLQNIGMALAAYFSEPSDFAVSIVEGAKEMTVPEASVPKQDSIEEASFIDLLIKSNLERSENCRDVWLGCALWE